MDKHISNIKTYFDIDAQRWQGLYQKVNVRAIIKRNRKDISMAFLCKYLGVASKVLDVGCGTGMVALDAVRKGFIIEGIDISEEMIRLCKQNFSQIEPNKYIFRVGDVADIDFPENSFDGILALGFLEYQKDEDKLLKKFQKILQPGGILICSGPMKPSPNKSFSALSWHSLAVNRYDLSRFKILLETNGFKWIDYKRHGYVGFRYINRIIGAEFLLHRVLTKISALLPIDRFANDIIVVGRK